VIPPGAPPPSVVEDATCLACGCLCDDIAVAVEGGRVVEARNACPIGRDWFLRDRAADHRPAATIDGRPAPIGAAIARAAEVLGGARAPVVLGLSGTTLEAQGAALALADRLGAAVLLAHEADAAPRVRAIQRVGIVSATLGEVRDRADVVVYWGVDPATTHPRHLERFVDPPGRFIPAGRAGRSVVVVDAAPTATAAAADAFLPVAPGARLATLWALRALIRGIDLDPAQVGRSTGLAPDRLRGEADRLRRARYGAFFFGPDLGRGPGGSAVVEAALMLVRDLNEATRFVALSLGGPGNPAGAEAVLAWQTGYPLGVDFAPGWPRAYAGGGLAGLADGSADAALIVADDPTPGLPAGALGHLRAIPRVVVAAEATPLDAGAAVVLRAATPGLHAGGTVMRPDGLTLPLRPALPTDLPTDQACLAAILDRLRDLDGRS